MALDDDIRILSGVGLFEGFTREQLRLMAFGAEPMQLKAGRKLYLEDDQADSAYIVVSGGVSLYRENEGVREAIGTVGPGSILGELARGLLPQAHRVATIDDQRHPQPALRRGPQPRRARRTQRTHRPAGR